MNPSGQPYPPYAPQPGSAQQDLNVPSLLLLIFGGLSLLMSLGSSALSLLTRAAGQGNDQQLEDMMRQLQVPPEMASVATSLANGPLAALVTLFGLALVGVMLFGAWQMRQLKMYPLAITSCAIAMVPCGPGCCCVVTLPVGIWALVVLLRPEVKAQFS